MIANYDILERFEFRYIKQEEAEEAAAIEEVCFPPNEACSRQHMIERINAVPDLFLVAIDRETGKMAGFLNGIATNEQAFRDEFFTDAGTHDPDGRNIMLLGLDVLPEYRRQGLARELMQRYCRNEKARGRQRLVLTCHKSKVEMYKKLGFRDLGESASEWGGERWHEMEVHMESTIYDITLTDFPRRSGEESDDPRIRRAIEACGSGVLYIPAGVYRIREMLEVRNCCSLLLHKSAVLKAEREMPYVLFYDAGASYPDIVEKDGHIVPSDDPDAEDWNLFVTGGVIDGAGLASCMCLNSFKHFTMRDVSFRNGKKYGLRIEEEGSTWTYELVAQNLYLKCTLPGLAGNAGISSRGGDSHFIDCIVVDYTKGFELLGGGSNRLTRCHVWGGPIPPPAEGELPEMLKDSVNYVISSTDAILTDCYADTGKTGFLVTENARLMGCSYFNNYTYLMDDVTVIDHRSGSLLVADGLFRKTSPHATLYKGSKEGLIWRDNIIDGEFDDGVPVRN